MKLGNIKTGEGKKSLHHGTLLINLDLNALNKYLNPNKLKLQSKGVDSVIQRVINLQDINKSIDHETACQAIEDEFIKKYDQGHGVNK